MRRAGAGILMLLGLAFAAPAATGHGLLEVDGMRSLRAAAMPDPVPWIAPEWCPSDPGRTTEDDQHAATAGPDVKFVYAYAADQPNRFRAYASQMQLAAGRMARVVADAHGSGKSIRFDLGTACGPRYLDIITVRLPRPLAAYRAMDSPERSGLFGIPPELRAAGAISDKHPARRYVIWADGMFTGDANGYGPLPADDQPGPGNFNNGEVRYAFYWGTDGQADGCETAPPFDCGPFQDVPGTEYGSVLIPTHELWHSIGAVSGRAKHASYGDPDTQPPGHCWDEYDILCGQSEGLEFLCGTGHSDLILDCGADDYFNPGGDIVAKDGARIWNTYESVFLCPEAQCVGADPPAGAVRLGRIAVEPGRKVRVRFRLSAAATVYVGVQRRTKKGFKTLKGTQTVAGAPGVNRIVLKRSLKPGRYRLGVLAGTTLRRSPAFRVR